MEIQNKFKVEDKVRIKILDIIGIVTSLGVNSRNGDEIRYYVKYSADKDKGTIEERWFDNFEIEAIDSSV